MDTCAPERNFGLSCAQPRIVLALGRAANEKIRRVEDLMTLAVSLVAKHPAVDGVELAGSRSRGTHEELSDWDFAVTTSDFAAVARDLPALLAPLHPLGQQWEPRGHFPVYQLLLPGPTKIEYLFLDHSQQAMPAPTPGPATLEAINTHFWDWIWWIATKASIARTELAEVHLRQLFGYLLRPIGLLEPPADIQAAIERFVDRRDQLERDYDITVSRALEEEVRAGIRQLGLRRSELALVYPACCRGGADIQGPSSRAAPRACDTPIRVIETAPTHQADAAPRRANYAHRMGVIGKYTCRATRPKFAEARASSFGWSFDTAAPP